MNQCVVAYGRHAGPPRATVLRSRCSVAVPGIGGRGRGDPSSFPQSVPVCREARWSGGAHVSSPGGPARSPVTKRFMHFESKIASDCNKVPPRAARRYAPAADGSSTVAHRFAANQAICVSPSIQKSRRICVRSRTGPQSAHLWWPAVAKLQAVNVPVSAGYS